MTMLTNRRLDAIIEALAFRRAGEIEPGEDGLTDRDYRNALEWAQALQAKRQGKGGATERRDHMPQNSSAPSPYGDDCAELLARWNRGDLIHSIEMGGFGPGYEQALQMGMVECLRWMVEAKPDIKQCRENPDLWRATIAVLEKALLQPLADRLGLTGAQWGAAVSLATNFYELGPGGVMADAAVKDRHIMVRRDFPGMTAP